MSLAPGRPTKSAMPKKSGMKTRDQQHCGASEHAEHAVRNILQSFLDTNTSGRHTFCDLLTMPIPAYKLVMTYLPAVAAAEKQPYRCVMKNWHGPVRRIMLGVNQSTLSLMADPMADITPALASFFPHHGQLGPVRVSHTGNRVHKLDIGLANEPGRAADVAFAPGHSMPDVLLCLKAAYPDFDSD